MFFSFPSNDLQWWLRKQRPTQFGDNKNYPGEPIEWWGKLQTILTPTIKEAKDDPTLKS